MDKKKALIITYYWPPAGGPGVQRWLKFVKYLPDFNIEPIVYVPENPSYPIIDETLLADIPKDITILKTPIKEPYKFAKILSKSASKTISKGIIPAKRKQSLIEKLLLYIRGNYFIPDARKNWVNPSVAYLSEYISKNNIKTIITTGPPHSLHLIGLNLKLELGVRWLSDFRDPWTAIGYHKKLKLTKNSQLKHKLLEKQVLNEADAVIVTSTVTKKAFQLITNQPIEVITNGYDYETVGTVPLDSKFSIAHIGSLLSERNPEMLWLVLKELIEEMDGFKDNLQLNLVGAVSEDVIHLLKKYNLSAYINKVGYVSHKEAIIYQKKSQLLLLIEIDSNETKCIIPGKLFEYMVSGRPIIAIGPQGSDVQNILIETNTGNYFCYKDYKALKDVILTHYQSFLNKSLSTNPIGLKKYSREALTKQLSQLI